MREPSTSLLAIFVSVTETPESPFGTLICSDMCSPTYSVILSGICLVQFSGSLHRALGGLLVPVVVYYFVYLTPRHEVLQDSLLGTRALQRLECPLHALQHRPERRHREDHDVVTHLLKLCGGHVGRRPELAQLVPALEGLGEDDLGTGLEVSIRTLDRRIESLHRPRIRPRDDDDLGCVRLLRRDELLRHLVYLDHLLPLQVPTPLRHHLVFDLGSRRPRASKLPHRSHYVDGLPESGVHVDDERKLR